MMTANSVLAFSNFNDVGILKPETNVEIIPPEFKNDNSHAYELAKKVCAARWLEKKGEGVQTNISLFFSFLSESEAACADEKNDVQAAKYLNLTGGMIQSYSIDPKEIMHCCCASVGPTFSTCEVGFHSTKKYDTKCDESTFPTLAKDSRFKVEKKPITGNNTCSSEPSYNIYKNGCCCKTIETTVNGQKTKESSCQLLAPIQGAAGADNLVVPPDCNADFFATESAQPETQSTGPLPKFDLEPIPQSGNCAELEHGGGAAAGIINGTGAESVGQALLNLQQQATDLNRLPYTSAPQIIGQIIGFFLWFLGSISFSLYVYAGFLWMISAGNAEQITKAKTIFVWTSLGIVAMVGSYVVMGEVLKFISSGAV